jgi:uncharacterized repeat protein (TIGR01451 family)
VLFNSSEAGDGDKKWALYWKAHLGSGSSGYPGSSLHSHTDHSGSQDVPVSEHGNSQSANLSIIKTDSPDPVLLGQNVTYTITVTNNGPATATGVTVTDNLPSSATFVSATPSQGSCSGTSTVTCNIGTIANGASKTITIVATPTVAGTIKNKASVTGNQSDPNTSNNTDYESTLVTQLANLSITKTDSPDPVLLSQNLTYNLTVMNGGPSPATGVLVTDNLPSSVTYVSATPSQGSCTHYGNSVTCSLGNMANGATATVTIVVTVNSTGTISNTANVTGCVSDPNTSNNSSTASTTVNPSANLSITKTDSPDPVTAGGTLTYTLTVSNAGPSTATGVSVTDTLPAGVTFVSATGTGWTCSQSSGVVTCTRSSLSVGTAPVITITVTAPTTGGTITNTASVTSGVADPNTGNNTATQSTTVNGSADLSITKTDSPDPVLAGQNLTYTITVTNGGPSTATGVTVTDTLPAGVTFVSATPSQGSCSGTSTVTCNLGSLTNGASATITIIVTPTTTGTISNTASVTSGVTDPNTSNNSASQSTTVDPSANLAITKTDSPDPVIVGQNLTYSLTVTNGGPSTATGVTVTDTLPAGVTFVSATPSQGSCSGTSTVTCNLGSLANGGVATITIIVTPTATGNISNTASVTSGVTDPNTSNNSSTASTTVNGSADLSITKTDSPDPVQVGQNLTYTITVTNNGPNSATGVTVTDTLPAGVTFVSATPSQGSCSGTSTVTCNLGTLGNGVSANVTIIVTPTVTGTISNTASVTSGVTDPNTGNNSSTASTTVNPVPPTNADLSITKTDSPDPVPNVGENLTYTITVTNNGPATATGVVMTDTLPSTVSWISSTPTQGSCSGTTTVTCNLGTLSNGASATITIVVMTNPPAGMISNTASVTGNQTDPNTANNTATQTTNVGDVSRLINISTRAFVGTGNNVTIGGFVVGGNTSKALLIRGRGPSLGGAPFLIPGTLANPFLQVYSGQTLIAQNDNWQDAPNCITGYTCGGSAQIIATGLDPCQPNPGQSTAPPNCAQESAVLITLAPGTYTVILSGVGSGTGVGLVEVFDPDTTTQPKLVNISTRAQVLTGNNVAIGGFIIGAGTGNKTILIRARGPSLGGAPFFVPGTLANPTIQLYSGQTVIAQNNDWQTTDPLCGSPAVSCGNASNIISTGLDPCQPNPSQTTAPPGCAQESAIYITLPPGTYTAIMRGVNFGTGVGLVEVFELGQ